MRYSSPDKQKGVALIFVLLIFAIITTVAVNIVVTTHRNTERAASYLHYQQAKHYAMAGEQYISALLFNDWQENKNITTWFQSWAQEHVIPVNSGQIEIRAIDEQALLNLNQLYGKDAEKQEPVFNRLFEKSGVDGQLMERIRNWGSSKPETLTEEDSLYMSMSPPYRTGGTPIASLSELRLMQTIDEEKYKKLRPFLTALPEEAYINFNTIPLELFPVMFKDITLEDAREILQARGKEGFTHIDDMRNHPALQEKKIDWQLVGSRFFSQYFSVWIKATYGNATYYLHSLIARDQKGNIGIISRENSGIPEWALALRQSARKY